jgi:hypothetical protein
MSEYTEKKGINPVELELDSEALREGFSHEVEIAKGREQEGKKEGYGRVSFVAARSAELGVPPELDENIREKIIGNLNGKITSKDAWGIAYQKRYMKEMGVKEFEEFLGLTPEEQNLISDELEKRRKDAVKDPEKWGDFFPMADHVKELAPEFFKKFNIEKDVEEGLKECLKAKEGKNDIANFVHIAYCAENCRPHILREIGYTKAELHKKVKDAVAFANEKKEAKDYWAYSFVMSQAKRLWNRIEYPVEAA